MLSNIDLEDNEETASLIEKAVLGDNAEALSNLILRMVNINTHHLKTSLLAMAIINRKRLSIKWILSLNNYVFTKSDISEIRNIGNDVKKKNTLDHDFDEKLSILITLNEGIEDRHKASCAEISQIKLDIHSTIVEIYVDLLKDNKSDSENDELKSDYFMLPQVLLLHDFQKVIKPDRYIIKLFKMIKNFEFDSFSLLLLEIIRKNHKININAFDNEGKTLLHYATITPDSRFLNLLLIEGADPNIPDRFGWTPLHYSVYTGSNFKIFKEMTEIKKQIDWSSKIRLGETVIDIAKRGQKMNKKTCLLEEDILFMLSKIENATLKLNKKT